MRFRLRTTLLAVPLLALAACDAELPEVPEVPEVPTLESLSEEALEGAGGIKQYLEENYQLTDVGSVDCPPNPSLSWEKGATFECAVVIGGEERTVEVSVLNENGGIQVSEPR